MEKADVQRYESNQIESNLFLFCFVSKMSDRAQQIKRLRTNKATNDRFVFSVSKTGARLRAVYPPRTFSIFTCPDRTNSALNLVSILVVKKDYISFHQSESNAILLCQKAENPLC